MRWLRVVGAGSVLVALALVLVLALVGSPPLRVLTPHRYRLGPGPSSATFDVKDNSVWVTYSDGIARIDSKGVVSKLPLACCIDFGFGGDTTGPGGNVWFNDFEDIGTVGASGKPRFVFLSERVGAPEAMTTGSDGALWFTDESIPASIGRISASGAVTHYRIPTPAAGWVLAGIVAGPDRALWFTEEPFKGGREAIGRMTTDGRYTRFRLPAATGKIAATIYRPGGEIAVGRDRALWFTEPLAHRIWRITPAGKATEYRVPAESDQYGPYGIAAGRDGALWFATETHFGRITTSGRITLWRVAGAQFMTDVVPGNDGTFWVPDANADVVFHITPPSP
jgi:virginiamycin B lyase